MEIIFLPKLAPRTFEASKITLTPTVRFFNLISNLFFGIFPFGMRLSIR